MYGRPGAGDGGFRPWRGSVRCGDRGAVASNPTGSSSRGVAPVTRHLRWANGCRAPALSRSISVRARWLREEGALHLGVTGETHHSRRWRDALPSFGQDPPEWRENAHAPRVLEVLAAMAEQSPAPRLARKPAAYLGNRVALVPRIPNPVLTVTDELLSSWTCDETRRPDLTLQGAP